MKPKVHSSSPAAPTLSETRFAHFVRSAPAAERQRVFVRAMKTATEAQRQIIAQHNSSKSDALESAC